jgi:hypothetical protein
MRRHGGPNTKTHRRLQFPESGPLQQKARSLDAEPAVSMIGAPDWARHLRNSRCLSGGGGRRAHAITIPRRQLSESWAVSRRPDRVSHNNSLKLTRRAGS